MIMAIDVDEPNQLYNKLVFIVPNRTQLEQFEVSFDYLSVLKATFHFQDHYFA
jgi:hypothetical protein